MLVKDYLAEKFSDIYVSTYMEHKKLIEEFDIIALGTFILSP